MNASTVLSAVPARGAALDRSDRRQVLIMAARSGVVLGGPDGLSGLGGVAALVGAAGANRVC